MPISSLDQLIAANASGQSFKYVWCKQNSSGSALAAGKWSNTATWNGNPCAMIYPAGPVLSANMPGLSMVSDFPVGAPGIIGTIPHGGPVAPFTKYLTCIEANGTVATTVPSWLVLVDMLVTVTGISMISTSAQTLNHPALPRYTNGQGVMMLLEDYGAASSATGETINTTGTQYTNQAGTLGQTIPWAVQTGTVANNPSNLVHSGATANNCGPFLPLAAGDTGVQSVQQIQFVTGLAAGTCCLILCKPLAQIPLYQTLASSGRDYIFNIPTMPVIQDGACLAFLVYSGAALATNATLHATLDFVWG